MNKNIHKKTRTKNKTPFKCNVEMSDNGMVIFPMANGKLATTWVDNVDAILSEGTGKLNIDRLSEISSKLHNAITLVDNRIAELQYEEKTRKISKYAKNAVEKIVNYAVGHILTISYRLANNNITQCKILVTKVLCNDETLIISGITTTLFSRHLPPAFNNAVNLSNCSFSCALAKASCSFDIAKSSFINNKKTVTITTDNNDLEVTIDFNTACVKDIIENADYVYSAINTALRLNKKDTEYT